MQNWITIGTPGYLGKERDTRYKEWNEKYGEGNWRLAWQVGRWFVDFLGVCALYEDAYFSYFQLNPDLSHRLAADAQNVYDDEISNIDSGLDYAIQETGRTHIQDIAIRRCFVRMGIWFEGTDLVRIRSTLGTHPLSQILSPGSVPFHRPDLIVKPQLTGWWKAGSVESFYQSNRFLQIR